MKTKNIILLALFFLMRSQVVSPQSKTSNLPVIDLSKKYPKKEIRLQDVADIKYIPLETTDDILLSGNAILSAVTDKYILVHEPILGDIFVFDRTGKIYAHFNRKGQSGREYTWIGNGGSILDEKREEIFVCSQSIYVYSLKGEYKRSLKINTIQNESKVYDFDDKSLLLYEDVIIDPGLEDKTKKNPYYLVSKKDGSIIHVLDIHFPKRYSTRMAQINKNSWGALVLHFSQSMTYGRDFVIADISSDTLFLLTQNKKLTPLLTRKPSVHASEPRLVWTTFLTTDKFILIGKILLDFNSKGGRIPILMYEFETGEISDLSTLDIEEERGKWGPSVPSYIAKNMAAELIQTSTLIETQKKKQLKGDFEKLVKTLDEGDNPVVKIIKFK